MKILATMVIAATLTIPTQAIATADGHNVGDETWQCPIGTCTGMAWGAPDGPQVRDPSITPAVNQGDILPAVEARDTSTPSPHNNLPVSTYPKKPRNIKPPSWPGFGFGVDDTK